MAKGRYRKYGVLKQPYGKGMGRDMKFPVPLRSKCYHSVDVPMDYMRSCGHGAIGTEDFLSLPLALQLSLRDYDIVILLGRARGMGDMGAGLKCYHFIGGGMRS